MAEWHEHSEAVWGHALRLWAPSEHLIEFSLDKIPTIFPTFFSRPLGAQQGDYMPVWFKKDERRATEYVEDSSKKSNN